MILLTRYRRHLETIDDNVADSNNYFVFTVPEPEPEPEPEPNQNRT